MRKIGAHKGLSVFWGRLEDPNMGRGEEKNKLRMERCVKGKRKAVEVSRVLGLMRI